ncbi:hypothetical protein ElyMa_006858200 [Elysia marginata]|uniref:ABC transmembrane type-1 domain-containing protein n=1 Tax=Elysia marginata TaxID=1093978 RepID=A0AAV4JAA4_9GAST|nr:hypothetical protein ElyMa_006858200 [Elysia marginata]
MKCKNVQILVLGFCTCYWKRNGNYPSELTFQSALVTAHIYIRSTESVYLKRRSTVEASSMALSFSGRRLMLVPWVATVVFISGEPLRPQAVFLATPLLVAVAFAFGHRMNRTFKYIGEMAGVFLRISVEKRSVADVESFFLSNKIGLYQSRCGRESSRVQRRSRMDAVMSSVTWCDRRLIVLMIVGGLLLFSTDPRPHLVFMAVALVDVVSFNVGSRLYRGVKVVSELQPVTKRIMVKFDEIS